MSYFEDQEECWLANNCRGAPSDYDPYDADNWPDDEDDDCTCLDGGTECADCGGCTDCETCICGEDDDEDYDDDDE